MDNSNSFDSYISTIQIFRGLSWVKFNTEWIIFTQAIHLLDIPITTLLLKEIFVYFIISL